MSSPPWKSRLKLFHKVESTFQSSPSEKWQTELSLSRCNLHLMVEKKYSFSGENFYFCHLFVRKGTCLAQLLVVRTAQRVECLLHMHLGSHSLLHPYIRILCNFWKKKKRRKFLKNCERREYYSRSRKLVCLRKLPFLTSVKKRVAGQAGVRTRQLLLPVHQGLYHQ